MNEKYLLPQQLPIIATQPPAKVESSKSIYFFTSINRHFVWYYSCAFPNTPKLRAVRASRAGTVAVLGEWLEECRRRRRRLPWRWFATDPQQRQPAPEDFDALGPAADSGENH